MTEKRLIDANALKTRVCNIPAHGESEQFYAIVGEIARAIERAETVDAVEVVRCRECANRATVECPMGYAVEWGIGSDLPGDDDFCYFGIRKEQHNGETD